MKLCWFGIDVIVLVMCVVFSSVDMLLGVIRWLFSDVDVDEVSEE